ncbi:MAG: hypothetical protein SPF30_08080 [Arcanobacterium sp.]|nr:hypothetical protein [Arcanobacterium sp.]
MGEPRRRVRAIAALCAAASCTLSACTAALEPLEPAAPKSSPTQQSTSAKPTAPEPNSYAAGAVPSWKVALPSAPTLVAYSEKARVFVVAIDQIGAVRPAQVKAFAEVGNTQVLERWSLDVPHVSTVTALAVVGDSVFLNSADASGRTDFLTINLSTGTLRSSWARTQGVTASSQDGHKTGSAGATAPQIVGVYGDRLGVVSAAPVSFIAELLDANGVRVSARDIPFTQNQVAASSTPETDVRTEVGVPGPSAADNARGGAVAAGKLVVTSHLVNTQLPAPRSAAPQALQPLNAGTQFVGFPQLGVMSGDECFAAADGFVCLSFAAEQVPSQEKSKAEGALKEPVGDTGAPETVSKTGAAVVVSEYDLLGHYVRQTVADSRSVAATLKPVSFMAAITARELGDALVATNKDVPERESGKATAQNREAAMFYAGAWWPYSQWRVPDGERIQGARALPGMAPLYQLSTGTIVNAQSGKRITGKSGIGYQGVGDGAQRLFEFVNGELILLTPAQH